MLKALVIIGFGVLAALLGPFVPAMAEVRDVRVAVDGYSAAIVIEFDRAPQGAVATLDASGAALEVSGVSAQTARLAPANTALLTGIRVEPTHAGALLRFSTRSQPVRTESGVQGRTAWIAFDLSATPSAPRPLYMVQRALGRGDDLLGDHLRASPRGGPVSTPVDLGSPSAPSAVHIDTRPPDGPDNHGMGQDGMADHKGDHGHGAAATGDGRTGDDQLSADIAALNAAMDDHQHGAHADGDHHAADEAGAANAQTGGGGAVEILAGQLTLGKCAAAQAAVLEDEWALDRLKEHGACLIRDGRADAAVEVYERLLAFSPEDADAHLGLGVAKLSAGGQGGRSSALR